MLLSTAFFSKLFPHKWEIKQTVVLTVWEKKNKKLNEIRGTLLLLHYDQKEYNWDQTADVKSLQNTEIEV